MAGHEPQAPGSAPSFLTGQRPQAGAADNRILASLEGRAPASASAPRSKSAWIWLLLLIPAVAIGWFVWTDTSQVQTPLAFAQQPSAVPGPSVPAAPTEAPAPPPAETARIVDDLPEEGGPGEAGAPLQGSSDPLALLIERKEQEAASAAQAPEVRPKATEPRAKPPAKPAAPRKPQSQADQDAALLAALMSHGLPAASPRAAAGSQTPSRAPAAPGGPSLAMFAVPEIPLEQRIRQCREKDLLAGERCRLQVCAGQWGLVPECPVARPDANP